MSFSQYESAVIRQRAELEKHRGKQADEEKKAAKADADALRSEQDAERTSSTSTAKSRLSAAARKRQEAVKCRERAAQASAGVGKAQTELHKAERRRDEVRSREEKKQTDKRITAEKQTHRRAEEAQRREVRAREQERLLRQASDRERDREMEALRRQVATQDQRMRETITSPAPATITVLFIATSPEDQGALRLDREAREIQQRVRMSEHRDLVSFEWRPATQVSDLLQILNEVRPNIVHFLGHGDHEGLAFEDSDGRTKLFSNGDLGMLLSTTSDDIRLAVFNSCDSSSQAGLACAFVDAAIGMDQPVEDEVALVFAGQFYNALAFGLSLDRAFEQARAQVRLVLGDLPGDPRLYTAPGIDPADTFLISRRS